MEINTRVAPLGDARVRKAIRHAIDSKFIAENIWFGLADPQMGLVPRAAFFRAPDLEELAPSQQKSNELLDAAGAKRPAANQPRFTIRLLHGQTGENPRTAEYVRQALARVGIEAKLESADLGTFIRRIYTDRDFDLTINTFFLSQDPTIGLQRFTNPTQALKGAPFGNAGGYENAAATAKWEAARKEPDAAKRTAMFQDVQRLLWPDMPIINIVEQKFFTIANKRFVGHTKQADSPYDNLADAWLAQG
jgi:peptide/nickel transport system substrate-binding protein